MIIHSIEVGLKRDNDRFNKRLRNILPRGTANGVLGLYK